MLKIQKIGESDPELLCPWPLLEPHHQSGADFIKNLQKVLKNDGFAELAHDRFAQAEKVFEQLSSIYAWFFGYVDAPVVAFDQAEAIACIYQAKTILEKQMIQSIMRVDQLPKLDLSNVSEVVEYLSSYAQDNRGVGHSFFDYVRDEMSEEDMHEFLRLEVIRNEVVDDEVALMIPGLQHAMKQTMSSNLWDECGNGVIGAFHTTWLRRLVHEMGDEQELMSYRSGPKPWFGQCTSHSLNSLLTSPPRRLAAYGHFLITEAWVLPHFERIVQGMDRLKIESEEIRIYFTAHMKIDPYHTHEMITALQRQQPALSETQLKLVVAGAHQAVAAGMLMYEEALNYFTRKSVLV